MILYYILFTIPQTYLYLVFYCNDAVLSSFFCCFEGGGTAVSLARIATSRRVLAGAVSCVCGRLSRSIFTEVHIVVVQSTLMAARNFCVLFELAKVNSRACFRRPSSVL